MEVDNMDSELEKKVRENNQRWHEKEAERYDHIRAEIWNFTEQKRINRDLNQIDNEANGQQVVDIGCGTGNLVIKFAQLGYQVKAVDISENMLDILEDKLNNGLNSRVETYCSGAKNYLEELESADIICFSSVLHHLPDYYQILSRGISALNPGGLIYVVHEPLTDKEEEDSPVIEFFDRLLTPRSSFHKWWAPDKEEEKIDFHIDRRDGIDLEEMEDFFRKNGMKIVQSKKYSTWKSGLVSTVDNAIGITNRTDFKVIAKLNEN